ncbi:MAG: thiamine pyrophosphate-dependent enzyme [Thaumarchaeota archaeon]|nr:thiamine pyrophosphate-dependent enzyme [Nitrososphaerota archaeon]MDG6908227.1 2-oxoacid:ferredoxin oxidoreductase subunit beta [Nitrososphaerota archaeon]
MTKTVPATTPVWCPGCGDFGVLASMKKALAELSIKPKDTVVVGGIGCSGSIHNNLEAYGIHSLHGRLLPTAIGVKLANPRLTVIAAGGDGDGYAIGAGHFVHALKKNPSIVYVVMQNGTYGLTKGQPSPTAVPGYEGNVEPPFDAILTALSIQNTTFIARGFSGNQTQLTDLIKRGIEHANALKGFAFIEVLSPCVTYNDTYKEWREQVYDLESEQGFDKMNRLLAYTRVSELKAKGKIATGLIYTGESKSLEETTIESKDPLALQDISPSNYIPRYEELLKDFR